MAAAHTGMPDIDPNRPSVRFINGVLDIFFGGPPPEPQVIKQRVDELLRSLPSPPREFGASAQDQAERLVEAAWETTDETGLDLAVTALCLWPNCADAYTYLGVQAGEVAEIALPMFTLGVTAGYEALGQARFDEDTGHFWGVVETQPFMRALAELARVNRDVGALEVAASHFAEMLRLNPNDDQGVRYELLATFLQMGATAEAGALLQDYGEEDSVPFAYGAALAAFQREGDSETARALLRAAFEANPHMARFIAGVEPMPQEISLALAEGSADEGAVYAEIFAPAWEATRHATGWMTAQLKLTEPPKAAPPPKTKRTGPREV